MSFEIAVKKAEGVERLLGVTVSVETVKAAEDKAVKRYASAARMPGFRPGKAPIPLIRKALRRADRARRRWRASCRMRGSRRSIRRSWSRSPNRMSTT
ncbi:MAG: trigger factor family protein [Gemmatimonadaceae bacterium]|nr:trigger factor family protein [Gemmatimonadaceae bacterium]